VTRAILGITHAVQDVFAGHRSVLILGPPSSGKTTFLRDAVRSEASKPEGNIVCVDPDKELGGFGAESHGSLGFARRAAWPPGSEPEVGFIARLAREHLPEAIAIDEPGKWFKDDAADILTSVCKSVRLLCTMRGCLTGEASAALEQQRIMQVFSAAIVLHSGKFNEWEVVKDLPTALLRIRHGQPYDSEMRMLDESGEVHVRTASA